MYGLEKVVKIWSKHFSAVLAGNDKNCTPNSVAMFQVQNLVIRGRFLAFPVPVAFRPEKIVKIQPKHFSTVLTRNDKNHIPNCVGYVSGAKSIHSDPVSIFSCYDGVRVWKSR